MPETNTLKTAKPPFDVDKIRKDFPVLSTQARGKPLVYLDNAATTQKPWRVINRVYKFDSEEYGTVRRGALPGELFWRLMEKPSNIEPVK